MKPNELRIGNLVNYIDGGLFKVIGIHEFGLDVEDDIETTYMEFENFEPIPLTEEWLLKFGFEIKKGEWSAATHKINTEFIINNAHKMWMFTPIWCLDYASIQYVHQLQNLYFALTNEELTYDL
jgi:hypothetical protein